VMRRSWPRECTGSHAQRALIAPAARG
jgi:hypothetical protein